MKHSMDSPPESSPAGRSGGPSLTVNPRHTLLRVGIVAAIGLLVAAAVQTIGPGGTWTGLVVLGAAAAVAELIALRPAGRAPLSFFYAVIVVIVRAASTGQYFAILAGALALVALVCVAGPLAPRAAVFACRAVGGSLAWVGYAIVTHAHGPGDGRYEVLVALAVALILGLLGDDAVQWALIRVAPSTRGREADLALIASGILMAVGYRGIGSQPDLGLWGPFVFAVPLLGAWYSFERLRSIRTTYEQTIEALSAVPELGGLARRGHAMRVASLGVRLGRELGLDRRTLEQLRTAALLHHLGHLCLDDPQVRGRDIEPGEVADKGAEILRESTVLAPSGDILASDSASLASQVLRAASIIDELTEGDESRLGLALEVLDSGPGYVYDPRVVAAVERVARRADLVATAAR